MAFIVWVQGKEKPEEIHIPRGNRMHLEAGDQTIRIAAGAETIAYFKLSNIIGIVEDE